MFSANSTATLRVTALRAENLKNLQRLTAQDPYVHISLDPWGEEAHTKASKGVNPTWSEKHRATMELNYYGRPVGGKKALLNISVMEWEATHSDRLIGTAKPLNVEKLLTGTPQDLVLDLHDDEGEFSGTLHLYVETILQGPVSVTVIDGLVKDLGQKFLDQENYVKVSLLSSAEDYETQTAKTKVAKGINPIWKKKNTMQFDFDGQPAPRLLVECWDKEHTKKDRLVGSGAVLLTPKIINANCEDPATHYVTVELIDPNFLAAGRINIEVVFTNSAYNPDKEFSKGMMDLGSMGRDLKNLAPGDVADEIHFAAANIYETLVASAPAFVITFSQSTKVPVAPLAIGFWVIVALGAAAVLVLFGLRILSLLVGVLYPSYQSFKAIESVRTDDDTQWLTYWILFGLFEVVDQTVFSAFVLMNPGNGLVTYTIKLAFLMWIQHPKYQGALYLYRTMVGPILRRHEATLDESVSKAEKRIKSIDRKLRVSVPKEDFEEEAVSDDQGQ